MAPRNQFNTFQTEKRMAAKSTRIVPCRQPPLPVRRKPNVKCPSQAGRQPATLIAALIAPKPFRPQCSALRAQRSRAPLVQALLPTRQASSPELPPSFHLAALATLKAPEVDARTGGQGGVCIASAVGVALGRQAGRRPLYSLFSIQRGKYSSPRTSGACFLQV